MKKILLFIFTVLGVMTVNAQDREADWAQYNRYGDANRKLTGKVDAVFMGNSITDAWPGIDPGFFTDNNYVGRGISGQTTYQMLARFHQDVVSLRPRVVVILAGTNDVARNTGTISLGNITGNIISMCDIARANGIEVILCSVLPAYEFKWVPGSTPAQTIMELNSLIRDYAESRNIPYVDYHSAMVDERGGLPPHLAPDEVHPTAEGYRIMRNLVEPEIYKLTGKVTETILCEK